MPGVARFAANLLRRGALACARDAVEIQRRDAPAMFERGVPDTFADPVEDTRVRVLTLAEAIDVDRAALFAHQIEWYRVALAHRAVDDGYLLANLRALREALGAALPAECGPLVRRHLAVAEATACAAPRELPSWLAGTGPLRAEARQFVLALLENRRQDAIDLVLRLQADGAAVADVHDHVLALALREIGRMWLMAEIPIADEHFASRTVETCVDRLAERAPRAQPTGRKVLVFAVGGDQHGLAVRFVADRFALRGHEVWNLGADMPASDLEWTLQDRSVDLVACGASLVLHLGSARATVERLRAALGDRCPPILVGGGPFAVAPDLHHVLGADAGAGDAATAVARGDELLARRRSNQ
ncbi:MAG: cobalamin-dependent protein [Planctomycetes bacterium]|nr:cobalamin-dependent protein [Planctomycetota bacterium]